VLVGDRLDWFKPGLGPGETGRTSNLSGGPLIAIRHSHDNPS
jgi:hypothetical protein